jgi:hypothetical protein
LLISGREFVTVSSSRRAVDAVTIRYGLVHTAFLIGLIASSQIGRYCPPKLHDADKRSIFGAIEQTVAPYHR